MNASTSQGEICIIRTFECDLCFRFDSVMLPRNEIHWKATANSLEIGTHLISHGDHTRIVYFNKDADYLGDVISLNDIQPEKYLSNTHLPVFMKNETINQLKVRQRLLNSLLRKTSEICIVGPSLAGKTSLALLLECGIPEIQSKILRRSPTLHKSTKRVKLGRTKVVIHDMGGQKDFWDGWKKVIPYSDRIIFIIDGSAMNTAECQSAFELVLNSRINKTPILVMINKYDLVLDGYTKTFIKDNQILSSKRNNNLKNIWVLKTSIFNGICYDYNDVKEETPIHIPIINFLS